VVVSRRSSGRPTLDGVAARAGVSPSTVSRVVRGSTPVSPGLEEAVRRAITETGYVPNSAARSLATSRTDSVGLVISDSQIRVFEDPFFAAVASGVTVALADTPLRFVIIMAKSTVDGRWLESYVRGGHIDGVMVAALHDDDPLLRLLERPDIPVVVLGRPRRGSARWYVDADNYGGGRTAVEHLLAGGRRRIATITAVLGTQSAAARLSGYRDALAEAGRRRHARLEVNGDYSAEDGYRAMARLLSQDPKLDAVFVASDMMATGAIRALREHGRRIPDDVAVVGFGGDPNTAHLDPPLTTVAQPAEQMGRELARLMVRALDDPTPGAQLVMPTRLVVRSST
jgi:DNA-binding LacI/PurR family transcriptional regulator